MEGALERRVKETIQITGRRISCKTRSVSLILQRQKKDETK